MTEGQRGDTEKATDLSTGIRLDAADLELIDMFLTNRLDRKERAMVETRIVADPEFRREVELTEAFRIGMRELAKRGDIAPLLAQQTSFWSRPPLAVAATVAAGLLVLVSLFLYQHLDQTRDALTAAADRFSVSILVAPTNTETLRFEQTRGAQDTPDVSWRRSTVPTLLELRFDVGLEPVASYTAVLEQVSAGTDSTVIIVPSIGIEADGQVMIAVNSALLLSGNYRIRLEPRRVPNADQQSLSYLLRIVD